MHKAYLPICLFLSISALAQTDIPQSQQTNEPGQAESQPQIQDEMYLGEDLPVSANDSVAGPAGNAVAQPGTVNADDSLSGQEMSDKSSKAASPEQDSGSQSIAASSGDSSDQAAVPADAAESAEKEQANSSPHKKSLAASLSLGSPGGSLGLTMSFSPHVHAGIYGTFFMMHIKGDMVINNKNADIFADFRLIHALARLDFYPGQRPFHFSAGILYQNMTADMDVVPSDTKTMGVLVLGPEELGRVKTNITFNPVAPYLGLGFGNPCSSDKLSWIFNAGLVYQGTPRVKMSATDMVEPTAQNEEEFEKVLAEHTYLRFCPVLMLGVAVKIF